jgi:hypothetical protein
MNGRVYLALGAKWPTGYQGDTHVHHQYPNTGLLSTKLIKLTHLVHIQRQACRRQ